MLKKRFKKHFLNFGSTYITERGKNNIPNYLKKKLKLWYEQ